LIQQEIVALELVKGAQDNELDTSEQEEINDRRMREGIKGKEKKGNLKKGKKEWFAKVRLDAKFDSERCGRDAGSDGRTLRKRF